MLRWTRDGVVRHEACIGVAPVLVRDPSAPPMIGLMASNVEPSEFTEGLVIEVLRERSDRGPQTWHAASTKKLRSWFAANGASRR